MALTGEQLEELAGEVHNYNTGFLQEREGAKVKKDAAEAILEIMKLGPIHDVEVAHCRIQVVPTTTPRSISVSEAEVILPADLFNKLVKGGGPSGKVRADIRPLRS